MKQQCVVITTMMIMIFFSVPAVGVMKPPPSEAELRERLQRILVRCNERDGLFVTDDDDEAFSLADSAMAITILQPFEQDPSACKREYAYFQQLDIAESRRAANLKEGEVWRPSPFLKPLWERMIYGICFDADDDLAHRLFSALSTIAVADISEQTKEWIRQHLTEGRPRSEVISLVGIANLIDQIPRLQMFRMTVQEYAALADQNGVIPELGDYRGWVARLALARLGSREDIQFCIDHIEAITDREVLVMARLGDYGYIRQPETIALLQKYLESDEIIVEGGDDVPRTGTSWYARRILAEILEGFPATGSLAEARAWMRAQTAFKIKR